MSNKSSTHIEVAVSTLCRRPLEGNSQKKESYICGTLTASQAMPALRVTKTLMCQARSRWMRVLLDIAP